MRRVLAVVAVLAAAAAAAWAQETPPRTTPQESRSQEAQGERVTVEDRAAAERALAALAERHRGKTVLTAHYVQRRHTELLDEPLVSEGELAFRREPAVVLFRTAGPRGSVVRLDERVYEVHRPQRKRLERFGLESPELPRALFAALAGDAERLRRDFDVVAFERQQVGAEQGEPREGEPPLGPRERFRIGLSPRDETVRERLQRLVLVVGAQDGALHSVSYRDPEGDLVEIGLRDIRFDPGEPPSFSIEVPEGTQVLEHAPKRRGR